VYLTAAWNTGLIVDFQGTRNGMFPAYYHRSVTVDPWAPTLVQLDFAGIDAIYIVGYGGKNAGLGGGGENFVMDNLEYSLVPEPGLALLVLGSLLGLRRRQGFLRALV